MFPKTYMEEEARRYKNFMEQRERKERANKMKKYTTYRNAVAHISNIILCNEIPQIDINLEMPVSYYNEEEDTYKEYYQFFITDCNETEIEYLTENLGLEFAYSPLIDAYILCVPHFGTPWSGVTIEPKVEWAKTHQNLCYDINPLFNKEGLKRK